MVDSHGTEHTFNAFYLQSATRYVHSHYTCDQIVLCHAYVFDVSVFDVFDSCYRVSLSNIMFLNT